MWFFILLVILAVSNTCVIVRGHRYTNTWAVQVNGDTNGVKRIVEKYGFSYKLKVNNKYFLQCIMLNQGENVRLLL